MSEVIPMRPFVNAQREALKHGPNVAAAIFRRVRAELRAGGDGLGVARELQRDRLSKSATPPNPSA